MLAAGAGVTSLGSVILLETGSQGVTIRSFRDVSSISWRWSGDERCGEKMIAQKAESFM